MFLRYIAVVLMLSSISIYANDPNDPYTILQKWDKRKAKDGELTIVMAAVVGSLLIDFWREEGLSNELPFRGTLYSLINKHQTTDNNPNVDNLKYLEEKTLEHHQRLLTFFRKSKNKTLENATLEAFPELK